MESVEPQAGIPTSYFLTPFLISVIGIVSATLAIVAYHLVLVKYCYRRHTAAQPVPEASGNTAAGGGGVEAKTLKTIPIVSYSTRKNEVFLVDQNECVICLGELERGDMVRLLPNCRHAFHVVCIDAWFVGHASCPVCRSPIVDPTKEHNQDTPLVDERNRVVEIQSQSATQQSSDVVSDETGSDSSAHRWSCPCLWRGCIDV